ncbi:hypothetical protein LTR95_017679, partial [Oleoguttula sp. CCFEE 5521]
MPYIDPETLEREWLTVGNTSQHRATATRSALAALAAAYQITSARGACIADLPIELARLGTKLSSPRMWEQAVRETRMGNRTGDVEGDVLRCLDVANQQLRVAG